MWSGAELGFSGGGVLFGSDQPPTGSIVTGGAQNLGAAGITIMPRLSLGLQVPKPSDPNQDVRVYAGVGPRVTATAHIFGFGVIADAGVDLMTYGMRVPLGAGIQLTTSAGRFALKEVVSFDSHLFEKNTPFGISLGGAFEWTGLAW